MTPMETLASQICNQISSVFASSAASSTSPPLLDLIVDQIAATSAQDGKIFVHGVGREGLMMKALCMRLAHLGLSAHCVFGMTTPPISSSDLLIASAGPGGFPSVDALCSVARSHGGRVLLLTAQPEKGSCVKHATAVAHIPAQTMADDVEGGEMKSESSSELLPMGSLYEAAMLVLFEMVVFRLGGVLGQSSEAIRARHTNLE